jgi:glycosyltransferase involved in cell wall biosynthesis
MNISYAITSHNEGVSLGKLIERIREYIIPGDEIVILDDYSTDQTTVDILKSIDNVFHRKLDKNFSDQKNHLNSLCKCKYIFQLDGDEMPTCHLMKNLHTFIKANPKADLFAVPRVNIVKGYTRPQIAVNKWNIDKLGRINYPDYQGRIYLNKKEIKWTRAVHEIISGHDKLKLIPAGKRLDLLHVKTSEKQEQSNLFYNQNYTSDFKIK